MKVIPISGVIGWDVTGQMVREALAAANGDAVEIQLSSVGGLVFDGLEIFNLIKNYEGETTARLMGIAASMGSYIPLAADKIISEPNAVMMIHNAWGIGMGNAEDLRAEAAVLEGLSAILADAYVKKTGKSIDEIKSMMDAETWLFGQEIMDSGFVDEIVGTTDQSAKTETVKTAKAELANAKKIVSEYEGGDSYSRVAALVDSMKPKNQKGGVAASAARPIISQGKKNMTLEQLKAEHPEVYAAAERNGVESGQKAERERVAELSHWLDGTSAAVQGIAEQAISTGKTYAEVASQLNAATAKGPSAKANDNPPAVASAQPAKLAESEVEGVSDSDVKALLAHGMTIEEIRANTTARQEA